MKPKKGSLPRWIRQHSTYEGDGCLQWPFAKCRNGYGRVNWPDYKGTKMTASRAMCIAAHGDPPSPKHEAAHSCGNGHAGCVNPNHLRWATKKENQHDRIRHGTTNRGERQGRSKLTEQDVLTIRQLYPSMTQPALAKRYGVDQSTISDIVLRRRWSWLD
jgi:hypothetical protein